MRNILATWAVAAVVLVAVPSGAWADDPAAAEAADANLESVEARRGMVFTLGIGGGFTLGLGIDDSTGTGGAGALRMGRVANRRTVIGLEILGVAHLASVNIGQDNQEGKDIVSYRRDATAGLVMGQYYFGPVFWIRAGAGVGLYVGEELRSEVNIVLRERVRLGALVGSAGAGIDVVRLKRFRAGVEIMSTGYLTSDGLLSANAFLLAFTID